MVIRTRTPIPDNWRGARCRELVITADNDPVYDREQQDDMVEFCNQPTPCPIRSACLEYALINNCADGVWGGMSPEDRKAMRRKYPLGSRERNENGELAWRPRPEWTWLPPGLAPALLFSEERAEMDAEDDYLSIRED